MTLSEAEVRQLGNQELADLDLLVRCERDRRSRLSAASAEIAALLKNVKADGGNPDQVVTEAKAAAEVEPTPEETPKTPESVAGAKA